MLPLRMLLPQMRFELKENRSDRAWTAGEFGQPVEYLVDVAIIAETARQRPQLLAAVQLGRHQPADLDDLAQAVNAAFTAGRPTIIRATPSLARPNSV